MRTKTLLIGAAALAAGLLSSQAQTTNVYSANVVGYVNVVIEGGGAYNLLVNPLNNTSGGNGVTNLFKVGPGDYDQILVWNPAAGDFYATQPYFASGSWSENMDLPLGYGFFYANANSTFTNTFVGEVYQGSYSNFLYGGGGYNSIGSSAPIGGSFTNAIVGIVPGDYDQILKWIPTASDFDANQPYYAAGAWSDLSLTVGVGQAVFYVNANSDQPWIRNFTVQ